MIMYNIILYTEQLSNLIGSIVPRDRPEKTRYGTARFEVDPETAVSPATDFIYIALSIFYLYTCIIYLANVGWQLVHYTVYGTPKSFIAFLRPVNCIVDSPPSNIYIIL